MTVAKVEDRGSVERFDAWSWLSRVSLSRLVNFIVLVFFSVFSRSKSPAFAETELNGVSVVPGGADREVPELAPMPKAHLYNGINLCYFNSLMWALSSNAELLHYFYVTQNTESGLWEINEDMMKPLNGKTKELARLWADVLCKVSNGNSGERIDLGEECYSLLDLIGQIHTEDDSSIPKKHQFYDVAEFLGLLVKLLKLPSGVEDLIIRKHEAHPPVTSSIHGEASAPTDRCVVCVGEEKKKIGSHLLLEIPSGESKNGGIAWRSEDHARFLSGPPDKAVINLIVESTEKKGIEKTYGITAAVLFNGTDHYVYICRHQNSWLVFNSLEKEVSPDVVGYSGWVPIIAELKEVGGGGPCS